MGFERYVRIETPLVRTIAPADTRDVTDAATFQRLLAECKTSEEVADVCKRCNAQYAAEDFGRPLPPEPPARAKWDGLLRKNVTAPDGRVVPISAYSITGLDQLEKAVLDGKL